MREGAAIQELSGGRLHLQHGPIDIVLKAWGATPALQAAYTAAAARFPDILPELVGDLSDLRKTMSASPRPASVVAGRMLAACAPFADIFITPMAAVAGSVADEILAAMLAAAPLDRAYVNNGGDIAVHLTAGAELEIGIASDFGDDARLPGVAGRVSLRGGDGVGGLATSGWRGRSFSLGIADSVTVLAANAAAADAAATLIANAVNVDSLAVSRRPARELDPDSDLGDRMVTTAVAILSPAEVRHALAAGLDCAVGFRARGLIIDAALTCAGTTCTLAGAFGRLENV